MMYIARRKLKMNDGRDRLPGQPVPEAAQWRESVLSAHLRMGWIERVSELPKEPVKEPVTKPAAKASKPSPLKKKASVKNPEPSETITDTGPSEKVD